MGVPSCRTPTAFIRLSLGASATSAVGLPSLDDSDDASRWQISDAAGRLKIGSVASGNGGDLAGDIMTLSWICDNSRSYFFVFV